MERLDDAGAIAFKGVRDIVTEVDHASEALIRSALAELCRTTPSTARNPDVTPWPPTGPGSATRSTGPSTMPTRSRSSASRSPSSSTATRSWASSTTRCARRRSPPRPTGRPRWTVVVSGKERLLDFVMGLAVGGRAPALRTRRVRRAIRIPRQMGSAALALAYVANGRFDAYSQTIGLSAWDVAAAGCSSPNAPAPRSRTWPAVPGSTWRRPPGAWASSRPRPRTTRALLELLREPV